MYRRLYFLASPLLVLILVIGAGVHASGTTGGCSITVQPGHSIQSAIDRASSGAIICMSAGIWEENITIDKPLTLRGAGSSRTCLYHGTELGPIIRVESDREIDVRIERLTVRGSQRKYEGVDLEEADSLTRMVAGFLARGISAGRAVHVTIADSTVTLCEPAIFLGTRGETPKRFEGHLSVVNSIISQSECGLYMLGGYTSIVGSSFVENDDTMRISSDGEIDAVDSHFDRNEGPIDISTHDYGSFTNCSISQNSGFGVFIMTTRGVSIANSRIENNGSVGVYAFAGQSAIINSRISGNAYDGIYAEYESEITITDCTIAENGVIGWGGNGITIEDSAHVTLIGNYIVNNVGYGVALDEWLHPFTGYVIGHGNTLPRPSDADGNGEGAVSPAELNFLMTSEGGELDRRASP